jgi:hypothetical protein
MTVKITTNNIPRSCIMGQWLDGFFSKNPGTIYSKLREQFDYLTEDEFDSTEFFKYQGDWYCVGEFIRVIASPHEHLYGWDGYSSDSYFSGVVMKYNYDGTVVVGRYCS